MLNPNQNANRSSISSYSHHHRQQQQQQMRHAANQVTNLNNHHSGGGGSGSAVHRPQQAGLNRPVQRPSQQQLSGHNQLQQQQQHRANPSGQQRPGQIVNPQSRPRPPHAPNLAQQTQQQTGGNLNNNAPPNPPLPNPLPKGWKKQETVRMRGIMAGMVKIAYGPTGTNIELASKATLGRKFRTKLELQRAVGEKYDMSLLDWRTGKLSHVAYRKQKRVKGLAANPTNYASVAKYDPCLTVPSRQTASIFKQPVSVHTSGGNSRNEPTPSYILNPSTLLGNQSAAVQQLTQSQMVALSKSLDRPKPTQLFWELRFGEMRAIEADLPDDVRFELELENVPKFKSFPLSNENILRSVAVSWYQNQNKSLTGQDKEFAKNARIFIDHEQPLIPVISVLEEDVKKQEAKLKELRRKVRETMDELDEFDVDQEEKKRFKSEMIDEPEEMFSEEVKLEIVEENEEQLAKAECEMLTEDIKPVVVDELPSDVTAATA